MKQTMRSMTIGVTLALLATFSIVASPIAQAEPATHYYVYSGGTGDGPGNGIDAAAANLPEGSKVVKVPYSACAPPAINTCTGGVNSFDGSVEQGTNALRDKINQIHAEDPNAHITISGFSQGSINAANVTGEIADGKLDIPASQVDAKLYADPTSPDGIGGLVPKGLSILGFTSPGSRSDFGDVKVQRECISGDPICNLKNLIHDPVKAIEGYFTQHPLYPGSVMKNTLGQANTGNASQVANQANVGANEISQLLPGLDLEKFLPEVKKSFPNVNLGQLVPGLDKLVPGFTAIVTQLTNVTGLSLDGVLSQLASLVPQLVQSIPSLIQAIPGLASLLPSLGQLLPTLASAVIPAVSGLIPTLAPIVSSLLPMFAGLIVG